MAVFLLIAIGLIVGLYAVQRIWISPLSRFPGPRLWACTQLCKVVSVLQGREPWDLHLLHQRYGDVVRTGPNSLSFAGAQAHHDIYGSAGPGLPKCERDWGFMYSTIPALQKCILSGRHDYRKTARRKLGRAFSEQSTQGYEQIFRKHADLVVERLHEAKGTRIDLSFVLNSFVWDCMAKLLFDENLKQLEDVRSHPWKGTPITLVKRSALAIVLLPPSLQKWCRALFPRLAESIAPPRCMTDSYDRLRTSLDAGNGSVPFWKHILGEDNDGLTPEELKTNVFIFAIAGGELTSAALCGLFELLISNPAKMNILSDELRSYVRNHDIVDLASLSALPYLDACVQEALRLYPPSPTGLERLTPPEGAKICGCDVPGGVKVSVAPFTANRSPANFVNAESFVPERWSRTNPKYLDDHLMASQPFSVGPYACLGRNLAVALLKVATAKILSDFNLTACDALQDWRQQKAYIIWDRENSCLMAQVEQAPTHNMRKAL